jgi:hypothetical protein
MKTTVANIESLAAAIERKCPRFRLRKITYGYRSKTDAAWFEFYVKKSKLVWQHEPNRVELYQGFFFAWKLVASWDDDLNNVQDFVINTINGF